jgi:deoxycytidylate deaminase
MLTETMLAPLTRSQRSYLNRATRLAAKSQVVQRHGAVVVKGGSVISTGVNSYANDPVMFPVDHFEVDSMPRFSNRNHLSVHAEVAAIRRASSEQLRGAVLYVARISKGGVVGNSAPCAQCAAEVLKAGIKKVIYTE